MALLYAGFIALILGLLALDLGVFHRTAHVVRVKEALAWSLVWITLGIGFSGFIYAGYEHHWFGLGTFTDTMATPRTEAGQLIYNDGASATIKYVTGFLIEKSLAVDNIFVIAMIFTYFGVPPIYQHRVLFYGIVGALLMRGVMIVVGVALITRFSWVIYVFGGFLIFTGVRMLVAKEASVDLNANPLVRLMRRILPVTEHFHGQTFFVRAGSDASRAPTTPDAPVEPDRVVASARPGARLVTPLFLSLVLVEFSDLIFALDSIPAIFAITTDPFLVFTSNVFAILGLRSLFFVLARMIDAFKYLKISLAVVLVVIGVKMMIHSWLKAWLGPDFNFYVLGVVGAIIAAGILASLRSRPQPAPPPPPTEERS